MIEPVTSRRHKMSWKEYRADAYSTTYLPWWNYFGTSWVNDLGVFRNNLCQPFKMHWLIAVGMSKVMNIGDREANEAPFPLKAGNPDGNSCHQIGFGCADVTNGQLGNEADTRSNSSSSILSKIVGFFASNSTRNQTIQSNQNNLVLRDTIEFDAILEDMAVRNSMQETSCVNNSTILSSLLKAFNASSSSSTIYTKGLDIKRTLSPKPQVSNTSTISFDNILQNNSLAEIGLGDTANYDSVSSRMMAGSTNVEVLSDTKVINHEIPLADKYRSSISSCVEIAPDNQEGVNKEVSQVEGENLQNCDNMSAALSNGRRRCPRIVVIPALDGTCDSEGLTSHDDECVSIIQSAVAPVESSANCSVKVCDNLNESDIRPDQGRSVPFKTIDDLNRENVLHSRKKKSKWRKRRRRTGKRGPLANSSLPAPEKCDGNRALQSSVFKPIGRRVHRNRPSVTSIYSSSVHSNDEVIDLFDFLDSEDSSDIMPEPPDNAVQLAAPVLSDRDSDCWDCEDDSPQEDNVQFQVPCANPMIAFILGHNTSEGSVAGSLKITSVLLDAAEQDISDIVEEEMAMSYGDDSDDSDWWDNSSERGKESLRYTCSNSAIGFVVNHRSKSDSSVASESNSENAGEELMDLIEFLDEETSAISISLPNDDGNKDDVYLRDEDECDWDTGDGSSKECFSRVACTNPTISFILGACDSMTYDAESIFDANEDDEGSVCFSEGVDVVDARVGKLLSSNPRNPIITAILGCDSNSNSDSSDCLMRFRAPNDRHRVGSMHASEVDSEADCRKADDMSDWGSEFDDENSLCEENADIWQAFEKCSFLQEANLCAATVVADNVDGPLDSATGSDTRSWEHPHGQHVTASWLVEINRQWNKIHDMVAADENPKRKVHFAEGKKLATLRPMVTWSFASRAARKGIWEQHARDRERFRCRIRTAESVLSHVLRTKHREAVLKRMEAFCS